MAVFLACREFQYDYSTHCVCVWVSCSTSASTSILVLPSTFGRHAKALGHVRPLDVPCTSQCQLLRGEHCTVLLLRSYHSLCRLSDCFKTSTTRPPTASKMTKVWPMQTVQLSLQSFDPSRPPRRTCSTAKWTRSSSTSKARKGVVKPSERHAWAS